MPENLRTEGSWRNYIMRHACPATWPDKTIWPEFYYGFVTREQGNVIPVTTPLTEEDAGKGRLA
jgi:hypothetical protein